MSQYEADVALFQEGGIFSDLGGLIVDGEAEFSIEPDRHFDTGEVIPSAFFVQCQGITVAEDMPGYTECAQFIETIVNGVC